MSGLITVFWKELADDFGSKRSIMLFALVLLAGILAIYVAAGNIKEAVGETTTSYFAAPGAERFVFLKLFTISDPRLPEFLNSFLKLIAFILVPIVGIALGFDAINNEKNSGTLSRLLSQPIFRDAVINGKFLAGTATIATMLTSMVLLVGGLGLWIIGVPPSAEEVSRLMTFLALSIIYGAFWLGLGILFSIFLPRVATSALASIAVWIFFASLLLLPGFIQAEYGDFAFALMRLSPITLFQEAASVLLIPGVRTVGFVSESVSSWWIPTPLSFGQSLLVVWPHLVSVIALTAICFAISYVRFMREEIRAT